MIKKIPSTKVSVLDAKGKSIEVNLKEVLNAEYNVLFFYPKDNTPGCTTESCDFSNAIGDFKKLKAKAVGISPDSLSSHEKFQTKQSLKLDLISDPERKIIDKFEVWQKKKFMGREFMGVVRSTFLFQGDKLLHTWQPVKVKNHVEDVKTKIKELRAKK